MDAIPLWLSVAAAIAPLPRRATRNPAMMLLAGSLMALLFHYGIATVPGVHRIALLLWAAAALLLFFNLRAQRRQRLA